MIRGLRIAIAGAVLASGATGAATAAHAGPATITCAAATYQHRASLVVEHGDGGVIRRCIGFDGARITAIDLLEHSGLETGTVAFGALGQAVCQIDDEPVSYPPGCWTGSSPYWVLFIARAGSSWSAAEQGASGESLGDGDAAGFRYNPQGGSDPPPASPAGTCPAETTAAPAPAAASTARPASTVPPPTPAPGTPSPDQSSTPTAAPIGITSHPSRSESTPAPAAAALNPGLLTAAAGGGALLGLIVFQVLRRRPR